MNLKVDFDTLRTYAANIRAKAGEYDQTVNMIQSKMQEISSVWQGSDSQSFTAQAASLQPKLKMMKEVIDQYAAAIDQSAGAYQNLMESRAASARSLGI